MSLPSIAIISWDDVEGKGGLGKAMAWLSEAITELGTTCQLHTPQRGTLSWTNAYGGHIAFWLLLPFFWPIKDKSLVIVPVGPGGILWWKRPRETYIAVCYHSYAQQAALVPGQWWKKIFMPLERRTFDRAREIWCYSTDTKQALHTMYGIPQSKIHVLPQLLDNNTWQVQNVPKQPGLCVCVARLENRKGTANLLSAWRHVAHSDAHLVIVGRGHKARTIDAKLATLKRATRIDHVTRSDLLQLIAAAELLIAPSYLEGFGLTVAEAMILGTAVIATDVPGHRSLIQHNQTGVLVSPNSPETFAAAIDDVLADSARREQMATNAKQYVMQTFQPSTAIDALQQRLSALY